MKRATDLLSAIALTAPAKRQVTQVLGYHELTKAWLAGQLGLTKAALTLWWKDPGDPNARGGHKHYREAMEVLLGVDASVDWHYGDLPLRALAIAEDAMFRKHRTQISELTAAASGGGIEGENAAFVLGYLDALWRYDDGDDQIPEVWAATIAVMAAARQTFRLERDDDASLGGAIFATGTHWQTLEKACHAEPWDRARLITGMLSKSPPETGIPFRLLGWWMSNNDQANRKVSRQFARAEADAKRG